MKNEVIMLLNFAHDNTIITTESAIEKIISILEQESQTAIEWFKTG